MQESILLVNASLSSFLEGEEESCGRYSQNRDIKFDTEKEMRY